MVLHATWAQVVYSDIVDLPHDQSQEGATVFDALLGFPCLCFLMEV